jgi:ERCC4-type nuclease
MIIKLDIRERELIDKLEKTLETFVSYNNIQIEKENLPLGDIIINDGTKDCVIIERKTLKDLAASIKDGRYEEQSYRLNGLEHHNHNIYYLIEGDINTFMLGQGFKKDKIDKPTIYSAIFSISYYKGFSVMRSNSLEESALIICNMAYKIGKDTTRKPYYHDMTSSTLVNQIDDINKLNCEQISSKEYVNVIKKVKKDNITLDNIGEIMLSQIPYVSSTISCAILEKYGNLPNLIRCIQEDNNCLANICINSNGKSRKINKNAIASITKYLQIKSE